MRALKAALYSAICRLPPLRRHFNYYQDAVRLEDMAVEGSVRKLRIDPVNDYGITFNEADIGGILRCKDVSPESLMLVFKMARLADVSILGSSGVTIDNRSSKALGPEGLPGRLHPNWVVARPLRAIVGDSSATYVNLLWMRKGHRHFFHFFWELLLPVLVYLKNWHDPAERVIFLVRDDMSAIQRDTWGFLEQDYPNITFQPLSPGDKVVCGKALQVIFQNRFHGVSNTMAREYVIDVANLYLRHYGIAEPPAGPGRRLFLSREGAAIRRVTNEPEIMKMLSRYGFEAFETGSIPFRQQAELFRSADFIVAPHGAALTNLMFCRPGTRVLSFFPAGYSDDCYLRLSKAMELDYHYIFGGPGDFPKRNHEMDVGELEAALKAMIDG
jgi:hypothetical protein